MKALWKCALSFQYIWHKHLLRDVYFKVTWGHWWDLECSCLAELYLRDLGTVCLPKNWKNNRPMSQKPLCHCRFLSINVLLPPLFCNLKKKTKLPINSDVLNWSCLSHFTLPLLAPPQLIGLPVSDSARGERCGSDFSVFSYIFLHTPNLYFSFFKNSSNNYTHSRGPPLPHTHANLWVRVSRFATFFFS